MSAIPDYIAHCHACGAAMDVSALAPFSNAECPQCAKHTRVKREFGPYTLVRRHAIGGMSMVFIARDNTLDREVALKILSEEFSADERRITAFEEEARITASFSHPNVVRVLTTGHAFGRFYIAMELVPGGHFEHHIRERGKIPEIDMLPLAIEVAHGLKAAHSAGLIHRDVKPGNILLDAEGHAKLVDFGLALVTQGGKAQATELWATPYYVPPETVEGFEEDFRSDIYAFGATLYHALAGKPSCGEESMATDVLRNAKKRVLPISAVEPSVSTETCAIIERAMAYEPDARFSSYDELIASLAVALSHLKSGRSEFAGTAAKRRAVKKRKERGVLAIGLAAMVLLTIGLLWGLNRTNSQPEVALPPVTNGLQPPVDADESVEIGKNYRSARDAVTARDFERAAGEFSILHQNPSAQEPTRSWAGVEAVLACYLDGRSADARKQARLAIDHIRGLAEDSNRIGGNVVSTLSGLGEMKPMAAPIPDSGGNGAARVVSSMLAGLKLWEQGLLDPAAAFFKNATEIQLQSGDEWAAIYQKIAADYLSDHAILTGPLFARLPADADACQTAIGELDRVLESIKTRGRARFNVRAWQLDLARHAGLLSKPKPLPEVDVTTPDPAAPPVLAEVMAKLDQFAGEGRFTDAVSYLKSLPVDPPGASRQSLLAIAESASVFIADLEQDLAKGAVTAVLPLKSGETMNQVQLADGSLTAVSQDGQTRSCKWADFSPDALIALHRVFVKNPANELEKLRRHECAIAYDWLTGNRARARGAASVLAESSDAFRQRWIAISSGLPN